MLATSALSLLLLTLSGMLLDAHRRDWGIARAGDTGSKAFRFARSRFGRRCVATTTIALVGVLIALWPLTPRLPIWVLGYTATLASLAALIFALGVFDAWASARYYRAETQRRMTEHTATLRELVERRRSAADPSSEGEA